MSVYSGSAVVTTTAPVATAQKYPTRRCVENTTQSSGGMGTAGSDISFCPLKWNEGEVRFQSGANGSAWAPCAAAASRRGSAAHSPAQPATNAPPTGAPKPRKVKLKIKHRPHSPNAGAHAHRPRVMRARIFSQCAQRACQREVTPACNQGWFDGREREHMHLLSGELCSARAAQHRSRSQVVAQAQGPAPVRVSPQAVPLAQLTTQRRTCAAYHSKLLPGVAF